ncbi:hypothetical protein [Phaeodactylibacter luteus]|uniref:hypothetical protein n=1 Tax=Phaeodactylibacter luteus TaxID=1564516 RepID=UPI001B8762A7|nr:hypothetical protein [Phaeodactylibacter luteus]
MKQLLFSLLFTLLGALFLQAQSVSLELTLRYNVLEERYEVYALPDGTEPSFFWGPSQITVVAPTAVDDAAFTVTSVEAGPWSDNSRIYAPAADPTVDFHGMGSLGAPVSFVANEEKLILHFTIPGGGCIPGLRLYINGSDPISSDPGMGGGDFTNTIYGIAGGSFGEAYTGNYENNGTSCDSDGDLLTDSEELLGADGIAGTGDETDPNNPDTDGDGLYDGEEVLGLDNPASSPVATGSSNPNNPCDPLPTAGYADFDPLNAIWAAEDCDGDGVVNSDEIANNTDPYENPGDLDGDGINDDQEIQDNTDPLDPCSPAQPAGYAGYDAGNATWSAADCDGDGVPNGEEDANGTDPYNNPGDTDGDGINDDQEAEDGTDPNDPCSPAQPAGYAGYDVNNAVWSAADCDGDGVPNGDEVTNGTDPNENPGDTDGDGINDDKEAEDGTDPNDPCSPAQAAGYAGYDAGNATWSAADCDGDGVPNGEEVSNGTDPYNNPGDTDGDGTNDDQEIEDGTDPNDPCSPAQAAGYAGYDAGNAIWSAADCDGDGVANGAEVSASTDPYNTDTDGDGVADGADSNGTDPCLPVQAAGYTGYDASSAIWSAGDCDGDGISNGDEDTNGTDPYNADTDGDGVNDDTDPDPLDPCSPAQPAGYAGYDVNNAVWSAADCDGDGVPNGDEVTNGTDPNENPGDTDGDGINDDQEAEDGTDPNDPCSPAQAAGYAGYDAGNAIWSAADCDGDGVPNGEEVSNGTDPYNNPGDTDGDGTNDDQEIEDGTDPNDPCSPAQAAGYAGYDAGNAIWSAADCDGDGVANGAEVSASTDPYNTDTDGDGVADGADSNGTDPCLPVQAVGYTGYDASSAIWSAGDCDGDGISNGDEDTNGTDPYNADTDGDGVNDDTDPAPNDPCSPAQPAGYAGYDFNNAVWSAADCDGDGVPNGDEVTNGTDPNENPGDTDGDGINDDQETEDGTDPNDPCSPAQAAGYAGYDDGNATWSAADCDGDGVPNGEEVSNGTDPYNNPGDTDGDGTNDDQEIEDGTDPNDPCSPAQAAGYAGYDAGNAIWSAADCDGDGVANGAEVSASTDPYNTDTDGDGVSDATDANGTNPCIPVQAVGYTGYDASSAIWSAGDCDGDGISNGDEDTNGTDPYNADTDGDGVNDDTDPDPLDPCSPAQPAGYAGYDVNNAVWSAADCDGDGVPNGDEVTNGTDPNENPGDTDGDGINDDQETEDGTDPNDPCSPAQAAGYAGYDAGNAIWSAADCDGDGASNGAEVANSTDPYQNPGDSDGDGVNDDKELADGTDPADPCSPSQVAGYTGYNPGNALWSVEDCDGDGVSNGDEDANGTDPYNDPGDSDGDGVNDDQEVEDGTDPSNPCDPDGNSMACTTPLQIKVLLQGALLNTNTPGLMRNDLVTGGHVPLTEPYTGMNNARFTHYGAGGGETTTAVVLAANSGTANAIVDWVFVELRDGNDPTVIVETRAALVQRDGDVVDPADGVSPVSIVGAPGGSYYIAIKHRNHLGAMTAAPLTLSYTPTFVDFTTASLSNIYHKVVGGLDYDGAEMVQVTGLNALWAGDSNADGKIKYQGAFSDNILLLDVLTEGSNSEASYNFSNALGYYLGDVTMDGAVKYQGSGSDPVLMFINLIVNFSNWNTSGLYNSDLLIEQLP